jgi:hypothetical protein
MVEKYGTIYQLAAELIEELKLTYPRHKVSKHTDDSFDIQLFGPSHRFLIMLNYTAFGVSVRVSYGDMLGNSRSENQDFPPHLFCSEILGEFIVRVQAAALRNIS